MSRCLVLMAALGYDTLLVLLVAASPCGQSPPPPRHASDAHVVHVGDLGGGWPRPVVPTPLIRIAGTGARTAAVVIIPAVGELTSGEHLRLLTAHGVGWVGGAGGQSARPPFKRLRARVAAVPASGLHPPHVVVVWAGNGVHLLVVRQCQGRGWDPAGTVGVALAVHPHVGQLREGAHIVGMGLTVQRDSLVIEANPSVGSVRLP